MQREFTATGINPLWVADMTCIPTWAGFVHLAVVLDVDSGKVVGWVFGQQQTADLVIQTLNMALITRKPQDVIHHSDQGSQGEFNPSSQHILFGGVDEDEEVEIESIIAAQAALARKAAGAASRRAMAVLEGDGARAHELIDRRSWKSFGEAHIVVFAWIEGWYDPRRRHNGLGQKSPINFERDLPDKATAAMPTVA